MNLNVQDTGGGGDAVVLIHGWPLSGQAWEHQIPALKAAGFRVITYDRRGFGDADRPDGGFDYDTLAADLDQILIARDVKNAHLVGFSMGGGEVARYVANHGEDRLKSVTFAAAVPPYLLQTENNPDGPLTPEQAHEFENNLRADRDAFFDAFTSDFFSAQGDLKVSEAERQKAIGLCQKSSDAAALGCMKAWATTDFRKDLEKITVPTLVLHGTGDGIVPIDGSGHRTHKAVPHSNLVELEGAPHGCNVSDKEAFNTALVNFFK